MVTEDTNTHCSKMWPYVVKNTSEYGDWMSNAHSMHLGDICTCTELSTCDQML